MSPPGPRPSSTARLPLADQRGRPLVDLRVSVTDRCNFRCPYCMPRDAFGDPSAFLPRAEILSFEEISTLARLLVRLGVRKIRLTGGEPLLRAELPKLVHMLRASEATDLALTTNGALLAAHADALADAGLGRVTISLDALDEATFQQMSDTSVSVERVLEGIAAADRAGLRPVKINTVIRRGVNEHAIVELAERFRGTGHIVRFIEYMDVGTTNDWRRNDVVTAREIVDRLSTVAGLEPVGPAYPGEVARRYRYTDGKGEIGIIASVSQPFCGACTRLRLSADGKLYTCLFACRGTDVKSALRSGASEAALLELLEGIWRGRADRYSELRFDEQRRRGRIEMSYIGG